MNKSLLNFNKEISKNIKTGFNNKPKNITPSIKKTNNNSGFNIRQTYNNVANKTKNTLKKYPIQAAIAIIILLSGIAIYYGYLLTKDYSKTIGGEPWIVEGNKSARRQWTIPARRILPSDDRPHGIEFTYAFWMYINNSNYDNNSSSNNNEWKHVFHKGNSTGIPLQSPGVWLYPTVNKLAINMNTYEAVTESCEIDNIPIDKWVHVTISVMDKNVYIYINGRLKKRCKLKGIPKLNIGNLYINNHGGFDGFMSRFKYFNKAIPYWKIEKMVNDGPAETACIDTGEIPPYLSNRWWMNTNIPE